MEHEIQEFMYVYVLVRKRQASCVADQINFCVIARTRAYVFSVSTHFTLPFSTSLYFARSRTRAATRTRTQYL